MGYCMSVWCQDKTDRIIIMHRIPKNNMKGQVKEGWIRFQLQVPNEASTPHG